MRKVRILPLIRKATIVPKTLNKEARTVDVIFSTGERIKRKSWHWEPRTCVLSDSITGHHF